MANRLVENYERIDVHSISQLQFDEASGCSTGLTDVRLRLIYFSFITHTRHVTRARHHI